MGANPTQAVGIMLLIIAFTVLAGAMAGGGIILAVVGIVLLAGSIAAFLKCKPLEQ
jgi:low temperature requirement protein LtrA